MRVMIPLFIINHSLAFRALCHLISLHLSLSAL